MWVFTQSALAGRVQSSQPSLCGPFDRLCLWLPTHPGSGSGRSGGLLCLCKQLDGCPSLGSGTRGSAHGTAGYLPCRSHVGLLLADFFFVLELSSCSGGDFAAGAAVACERWDRRGHFGTCLFWKKNGSVP